MRLAIILCVGLLAPLALAGCVTSQERAERAAAARARIAQEDDSTCRSYGAMPGTPAYIQCRTTRDQMHQASADADASRRAAALAALASTPIVVQQPAAVQMPAPMIRPPINCTSNAVGGTVMTNCN